MKSPFVQNVETIEVRRSDIAIETIFEFRTNLIDSYEKYPESIVSGLTKIGGLLALLKIV